MKAKNEKNLIIKAMVFVLLAIILTVGVTYAYFQVDITGNEDASTISVGAAQLKITYEGTETITANNVIPGWKAKKYFNIKSNNPSNIPITFDVVLVIDKSNFKKAVKIIEKELLAMKNGEFDENDIKIAKEYYNTAMDEILESEDRIINNYYVMEMIGTDDIDKKRSMMSKVVKEAIVEVAKKVYMDTIFCLEGVADEES